MQERAAAEDKINLNDALQKHDPKAKAVRTVEDFALIKDRTFLLALRGLALIDKGRWTILQGALDLRNQCGHPTRYKPGEKKASSFVEDVVPIVFA